MEKQSPVPKKLLTCQNAHNQIQNFIILLNQEVGSGYFGTVKKAYRQDNPFEQLAVKIIPYYRDEDYKAIIEKEVQVIKSLENHPNLVKVTVPQKCWSENNFYIFMEYCNEGTLQQQMRQKLLDRENFTQPQIFKTFFQVLSGYRVLWKKKILHQDLKPQNILIKNGVHKLTDFGFSIFYDGVKLSNKRQGTLEYMPLEKLTKANYDASTKSDVYSLGVIFFKMITGRHPYILRPYEDDREFIDQLSMAELRPPGYVRARMSMPMQHLFEVVLKMVAKNERERIEFEQIYSYIEQESSFLSFAQQQQFHSSTHLVESQQLQIPAYLQQTDLKFVQYSSAFTIPFSLMKSQQQQHEEILRRKSLELSELRKLQTRIKIENYLCSMRMMVYFFDRLARRLTVQMGKKEFEDIVAEMNPTVLSLNEKVIIYLVFLSLKITKQTLNQSRKPTFTSQLWTLQQWASYRETRPNVIDLIQNDEKYLEADKIEITMREKEQSKIKEIFTIIEEYKQPLIEFMELNVKPPLEELLKDRTSMIGLDDKKELTTLNYILTAIEIIDNFQEKQENWEQLQAYFRETETQQIDRLREKVHQGLKKYDLPRSYIEGDWQEQEMRL